METGTPGGRLDSTTEGYGTHGSSRDYRKPSVVRLARFATHNEGREMGQQDGIA